MYEVSRKLSLQTFSRAGFGASAQHPFLLEVSVQRIPLALEPMSSVSCFSGRFSLPLRPYEQDRFARQHVQQESNTVRGDSNG